MGTIGLAGVFALVLLAWLTGGSLGGAGFWLATAWRDRAPRHPR